jgi:hypothetical protein
VIAIIGVLIGLLLPALGLARRSAQMTVEMAAARTLGYAYQSYSSGAKGELLPGFKDGGRMQDDEGREMPTGSGYTEIRKRYPWRLAPWLDYRLEGALLVNDQAGLLEKRDQYSVFDYHYGVSLSPNLGLNSLYLGGDGRFGPSRLYTPLTRLPDAVQPSSLMVFVSAQGSGFEGLSNGYFFVRPPQSPSYDRALPASVFGYVAPRWSGSAVAAMLDGHARTVATDELQDRRLWSNEARRVDDPNLRP